MFAHAVDREARERVRSRRRLEGGDFSLDGKCDALGVYGKVRRDGWIRKHCSNGHYATCRNGLCVVCARNRRHRYYLAKLLMAYWAALGMQ